MKLIIIRFQIQDSRQMGCAPVGTIAISEATHHHGRIAIAVHLVQAVCLPDLQADILPQPDLREQRAPEDHEAVIKLNII